MVRDAHDAASGVPVIDAGVRHMWTAPAELMGYMRKGWRELLTPLPTYTVPMLPPSPWPHPDGEKRRDGADGAVLGTSVESLRSHVLDAANVEHAVLTHDAGRQVSVLPHPYLAREIARAANDWSIDRWLGAGDERISALVLIANQLPEDAALEIRRAGTHRGMVGVSMATNGLGLGYGHPAYLPIYAAAAELGLPIVVHAGLEDSPNTLSQPAAAGVPMTLGEHRALGFQALVTHIQSFIAQGVFVKYPELKVLIAGAGAPWLVELLWNMDTQYEQNGREMPWVTRRPSEYFRESIRVTTYPMDDPALSEQLVNILECAPFDMSEVLCYASGWPQWDSDSVATVSRALPEAWHARVLHDNAAELFGWSSPTRVASAPSAAVGEMPSRSQE